VAKRKFWGAKGPARVAPIPPESLRLGVGPGDYDEQGRSTLALLERLTGVETSDRVLDVGCGLGRIAWPLSERLGRRGSYTGLDVVKAYTDWCESHLGLDPARFHFHHADVHTSFYNPGGAIEPGNFVFPWPDGSFTLAIATSLFTHLLAPEAAHYLGEIARTLAPGGRLFASFFLLDDRGRYAAATGLSDPTFLSPTEHGLLHDPAVPESGVAHDAQWLMATLAAAGLEVSGVHPGRWKGLAGLYYQDVVVATRSERAPAR
jgi:SAM-dependent methyltransferase